jgi:DNA-binding transcriptional MerR regulator
MADDSKHTTKELWLTPAECAKQTGLTVRALRVYERYELVAAKRTDNRWRYYGIEELERLNTIAVLKTIGMTLAQIRDLLRAKEPSLERTLHLQVKAWKTKKLEAERGIVLAEAALRRVQTQQSLSVDDICQLIRGLESMSDQLALIRNLLHETLAPEELQAAMAFMKQNFDLEQVKLSIQKEAAIFRKLRQLMESGSTPESEEVQRLLVERNEVSMRHGGPERALKTIEWNRSIGVKFFSIEARTQKKMRSQPEAEHDPRIIVTPKVWDFFLKASKQAPWTGPMIKIIDEAKSLLAKNPDPTSDEARDLVRRFRETYQKYSIGDPDVTAKLVPYWEAIHDGWPEWAGEENQAAWLFLSEAVVHSLDEKKSTGS